MTPGWLQAVTVATAVGAAVVGGVFYAFSTFVMPGIKRLPAAPGIAAMQVINIEAERPGLLSALLGTAIACVALVVIGVSRLGEPDAVWLLVGSALYLVTIIVTMMFHVPRNNALARVDPDDADAAVTWGRYSREWTMGNHVRAATSIAGGAVLIVALLVD